MVKIGKKKIGDGNPTYITFEIGPTHSGFKSCVKYIDSAYKAKADAIKIQTYTADTMTLNISKGDFYINDKNSPWFGNGIQK